MSKIRFVTDSAADIPADLARELEIQILPFHIAMEDRELRDGVDFTPQEFYQALVAAPHIPTHSQHNPFTFQECYEQAWRDGCTHLIYTAINSKGSATYQNSLQARDLFYDEFPQARDELSITILDSRIYTMGYGWAVVQGARMAREGKPPQEIIACIQDWIDHVKVVFAPYDLKFAKKSGRISAAAAFVGEALGLKPIMTFLDGESRILTKVRGEKNIIPAILEQCETDRAPGTPYLCICGSLEGENQRVHQSAVERFGREPELDFFIGGVIAINAGPNLVGIIYRKKD